VFPSGNVSALGDCLRRVTQFSPADAAPFAAAARAYVNQYSRAAFRAALLRSLAAD
jgi:hypothetical protein